MDESTGYKINLNTADQDTLTQIPGIGPELAQNIIAARPFSDLEELSRVRGIGAASIHRLLPHLTLSDPDPDERLDTPVAETAEAKASENQSHNGSEEQRSKVEVDLPEPEVDLAGSSGASLEEELAVPQSKGSETGDQPQIEMEPEQSQGQPLSKAKAVPKAREKWITRNLALGLMSLGFLITLVLGILISLGIMAGINRGQLQFAGLSKFNALEVKVGNLDSRASSIEQDIQGLRDRIDNMDTLGARVNDIEKNTQQLKTDIEQVQSEVEDFSTQLGSLQEEITGFGTEIETLQSQGEQFTSFLDGLRSLLENLVNPQEVTE